jgi:hypothetical protein
MGALADFVVAAPNKARERNPPRNLDHLENDTMARTAQEAAPARIDPAPGTKPTASYKRRRRSCPAGSCCLRAPGLGCR